MSGVQQDSPAHPDPEPIRGRPSTPIPTAPWRAAALYWSGAALVVTACWVVLGGDHLASVLVVGAAGLVGAVLGVVRLRRTCRAHPKPLDRISLADQNRMDEAGLETDRIVALPPRLGAVKLAGLRRVVAVGSAVGPWIIPLYLVTVLLQLLTVLAEPSGWRVVSLVLWLGLATFVVVPVRQSRRARAVLREIDGNHEEGADR